MKAPTSATAAALTLAFAILSRSASAQPGADRSPPPPPSTIHQPPPDTSEEEEWYGWKIALVDVAAASLAVVAVVLLIDDCLLENPCGHRTAAAALGAYGLYLASGPVIHWLEDRPLRYSLGSLAARTLLPAAAVLVADSMSPGDDGAGEMLVLGSLLVPSLLDIACWGFAPRKRAEKSGWHGTAAPLAGGGMTAGLAVEF